MILCLSPFGSVEDFTGTRSTVTGRSTRFVLRLVNHPFRSGEAPRPLALFGFLDSGMNSLHYFRLESDGALGLWPTARVPTDTTPDCRGRSTRLPNVIPSVEPVASATSLPFQCRSSVPCLASYSICR